MSGGHRLVIGEINKDLKGEEYLKAVDEMATAEGGDEGSKEDESAEGEE